MFASLEELLKVSMNAPVSTDLLKTAVPYRRRYLSVRIKFGVALTIAIAWTAFSVSVASAWMRDLAELTNPFLALWTLTFVAFVPGFMNAFLATSLLLDRRPPRRTPLSYPGVTILIAAYNEEAGLAATLESIANLNYVGEVEALVLNDGSKDRTVETFHSARKSLQLPENIDVRLLDFEQNRGKAAVLNDGLAAARHDLVCTIDGDSRLRSDSLKEIVERYLSDPPGRWLSPARSWCETAAPAWSPPRRNGTTSTASLQ
ncbi:glycosyltransferase family 2 protein [Sphingomonas daechungensis]|uniref:glycosyltransferase family 2 protein n=1 Tax=Sphingomonas daechungensis TaxID=1176646 RepID=UPI001CB95C38|nr:glycosyltransferase family 2 protein [Sphingomonas daechungensis]